MGVKAGGGGKEGRPGGWGLEASRVDLEEGDKGCRGPLS